MNIQHVAQVHSNGCGVACVAMLTGQTYAQTREQMGGEPADRGMTHYEWFEALSQRGFAVQFLFQRQQKLGATPERDVWPLAPWAPAHIVQVGNHYIVLLRDGSILDPAIHLQSNAGRRLSDYPSSRIYSMGGVFPVGARTP